MSYKLDKTNFSSEFGNYLIYETWNIPVLITGTIPDVHYNVYQAIFDFNKDKARGRVSIQRPDTGLKTPFNTGPRLATYLPNYTVYQYTSTETVQTDTHYDSSGSLFVNLFIYNRTGGTITLVTQTLNIIVEFYVAPVA